MFNDHEIYGVSNKKMVGMGKSKEMPEEKEVDMSMEEINEMMDGMGLKRSGEGLLRAGNGLKRSGEGLLRAGNGLKRSGDGLKRSGDGLKRAGNGLKRSGAGLIQDGGAYETIGINQIGGCDECPIEEKVKPKIGQELRELMIKQFCK